VKALHRQPARTHLDDISAASSSTIHTHTLNDILPATRNTTHTSQWIAAKWILATVKWNTGLSVSSFLVPLRLIQYNHYVNNVYKQRPVRCYSSKPKFLLTTGRQRVKGVAIMADMLQALQKAPLKLEPYGAKQICLLLLLCKLTCPVTSQLTGWGMLLGTATKKCRICILAVQLPSRQNWPGSPFTAVETKHSRTFTNHW